MESVHHTHHLQANTSRMKVTGLLLATLGLVVLAQAKHDYFLKCSPEEMGIRWPSYKSNAEYYVCHRLGDRPMVITCNPGEVFTFVLQICASPSRYIPAPALELLPTAKPMTAHKYQKYDADSIKPLQITNLGHPPIFSGSKDLLPAEKVPQMPPAVVVDIPTPPTLTVVEHNVESEPKKDHHEQAAIEVAQQKPADVPPMPPTPAPTPPVVAVKVEETADNPKVSHPKKPAVEKKKTAAKPGKSDKNKATPAKAGKKTPKKTPKAPKSPKSPKKTPASVKKTPKTPTKA